MCFAFTRQRAKRLKRPILYRDLQDAVTLKPHMRHSLYEAIYPCAASCSPIRPKSVPKPIFKVAILCITAKLARRRPVRVVCHEASPVQTAMRNCTRDEGRSFEAGSQVLASNRCKLLSSRAMVVSVAVNVGRISRRVRLREASASEPSMNCRKRISCHVPLHTRMDETAPIDSAALFGSSFWVDDVKTGG